MAVQAGEGTVDIIYGSTSIPAGAITHGGYLARPDGEGEWPTVLIYGPAPQPTSSVKNICRVFARHGIAALAPDVTTDHDLNRRIAMRIAAFISDPGGTWSNAQFGYGVLGFGPGAHDASANAADDGRVDAIAFVAGQVDALVANDLSVAEIPSLFVGSRADEATNLDDSLDRRDTLPQMKFVIYSDAPEGWWNDDADGFDDEAAVDTMDRVISFFGEQLPPRV
ncbi:MAG: hypothetical protein BMS9Abin17_0327 [Acidimicrobiia bacterium]|nr:MAG: hypothetical protein BMS9Abin17_0327 [Acidimicrobiia bacterium]